VLVLVPVEFGESVAASHTINCAKYWAELRGCSNRPEVRFQKAVEQREKAEQGRKGLVIVFWLIVALGVGWLLLSDASSDCRYSADGCGIALE
jgi:poly(3-hydroxybutyrate) depolymerase